jgi:hypothetical protein
MTNDTSELLGRTSIRHQVSPYYIFLDERPIHAPPIQRRVQRGFDVDLYGSPRNADLHRDDELLRSTLEDLIALAERIVPQNTNSSEIEVIPVEDALIMNPSQHFKAEALLRIRITHGGALDQPAGPHEEEVVHTVVDKLELIRAAQS